MCRARISFRLSYILTSTSGARGQGKLVESQKPKKRNLEGRKWEFQRALKLLTLGSRSTQGIATQDKTLELRVKPLRLFALCMRYVEICSQAFVVTASGFRIVCQTVQATP